MQKEFNVKIFRGCYILLWNVCACGISVTILSFHRNPMIKLVKTWQRKLKIQKKLAVIISPKFGTLRIADTNKHSSIIEGLGQSFSFLITCHISQTAIQFFTFGLGTGIILFITSTGVETNSWNADGLEFACRNRTF